MIRRLRLGRRWTSQRWFASVLIAMVVLIALGTLAGEYALSHTTAVSNRLTDRLSPARLGVAQLDAALVNQETGVRGFLLTGDQQFLDPYQQGLTDEKTAAGRIRDLAGGEPGVATDLDAVTQQAAQWRANTAEPLITARRSGPGAVSAAQVDQSRVAFDAVRSKVDVLDARLVAARASARSDLDDSRRLRDTVFTTLACALLLFVVLIAVLLRVVVLRPLAELGTAVRRVAAGDFEHQLTPRGPADLAALTGDVESMRSRLAASLRDSEQQQVELRRSNADLEQFAYVASHDLQEPLRKVASFCQLLQRRYADALDDRAQQYIGFAVDGATRMQQLINDLLAFSRIGRLYDASQPVDLSKIADEVSRTLALSIEESEAVISWPELPTVPGDPTLLTMLWQNLIGNALKFRRPGTSPSVEVTAARGEDLWTFAVQDNGIGIEAEFADKIFVIFQRLHPREAYEGTGIGLALCKKIVEHHGGTIHLDPEHSDGARLVFTLPA